MLTKKAMARARKLDLAYGGTGNCAHQFGGPEPPREPAHWRTETEASELQPEEKKGLKLKQP